MMMSEMDVNAIAGTLKLYFRELPEPLFTDDLYPNFAGGISKWAGRPVPQNCRSTNGTLCSVVQLCPTAWPKRAAC